jgi:hypothetical protein
MVVATVLAYRKARGDGLNDWEATPGTRAAYQERRRMRHRPLGP